MTEATHTCPTLIELEKLENRVCRIQRIEGRWTLVQETFALPVDVRAGEAHEFGEFMFGTNLPITFCPFCGTRL
jgi:hypothetical protein